MHAIRDVPELVRWKTCKASPSKHDLGPRVHFSLDILTETFNAAVRATIAPFEIDGPIHAVD